MNTTWHLMMRCTLAVVMAFITVPSATREARAADPRPDLARVDAYAQSLFERSGLPGMALAVVEGDRVLYERGFGVSYDGGPAIAPDTLFIIGSTTKSMTALAVLQLAGADKLRLDDPVVQYFPQFLRAAEGRAITLRMLLNQTSGLSHETGDQPVLDGSAISISARNWVLMLGRDALNRAPGLSYEYSNANYVVLGAIVQAASGQSYRDYMRDHVFLPLSMTHTYASLSDVPRDALAQGHKQFLGRNIAAQVPYPTSFVPVGFIISSAEDIGKYLAAQLPGSATASLLGISAQSINEWHRGVAAMDPAGKGHYAMGWAVDTFNGLPVVYHSGDTGVFASEFTLDLNNRRAVVLLTNGSNWLTSPYVQEISSGIVNILASRAPRDDTNIHTVTWAILAAVLALPVLQIIALVISFRTGRPRSILGRVVMVLVHAGVATALLYALPREIFGIPLSELVISVPDMGMAALASGVAALLALLVAMRGARRAQ